MTRVVRFIIAAALCADLASPSLATPDLPKMYAENCSRCHQLDGRGLPGAYPGLAGDKIAIGPASAPIRLILDGKGEMPSFRSRLTDQEMSAALSYVRNSWGNNAGAVEAADFARARADRGIARSIPLTRAMLAEPR